MHVDSSVYITVAQGITRGQLPYRDFVDNKGPLTYLINVPGLLIGGGGVGFTGIWITELILMWGSVLFAYKTALFFGGKYKALMGTIFSFAALLPFFIVNAGTEEYSLPFLMVSLYIFTKYFFSPKQEISFFELVILGVCFACAIMIRLNMFPLWAGFCLVIFVESVMKRRFVLLLKYIAGFCLGIIIVFVPVFLYLKLNKIIGDFFVQVIFNGAARGFCITNVKEIWKNFYSIINRQYSFFPLFVGLFWLMTKYTQNRSNFYFGYVVSYFLMVFFLSFSGDSGHYNLVLIPFFVPALTFVIKLTYSSLINIKAKKTILVLFFCFIFSQNLLVFLDNSIEMLNDKSGTLLIKAGKMIDENTKPGDKIISLGFNGYIYPFTQRNIASKYFYQGSGLYYIPGAKEKFISDITLNKPVIIAIFTAEDGDGRRQYMEDWHTPIFEMINNEYRLLSDENGFNLFIRK
jgi:hypothetical protein